MELCKENAQKGMYRYPENMLRGYYNKPEKYRFYVVEATLDGEVKSGGLVEGFQIYETYAKLDAARTLLRLVSSEGWEPVDLRGMQRALLEYAWEAELLWSPLLQTFEEAAIGDFDSETRLLLSDLGYTKDREAKTAKKNVLIHAMSVDYVLQHHLANNQGFANARAPMNTNAWRDLGVSIFTVFPWATHFAHHALTHEAASLTAGGNNNTAAQIFLFFQYSEGADMNIMAEAAKEVEYSNLIYQAGIVAIRMLALEGDLVANLILWLFLGTDDNDNFPCKCREAWQEKIVEAAKDAHPFMMYDPSPHGLSHGDSNTQHRLVST
jgi:hypothetical protein